MAAAKKTEPITKEQDGSALPTTIQLTCPFGYLDDKEVPHFWQANQTITDPDEIKDLIDHGAEHVDISE